MLQCHDINMKHHLQTILDGEYDINYTILSPVILDIGANVGAFTKWVIEKKENTWKNPIIYCYEPSPRNYQDLIVNIGNIDIYNKNIHVFNHAVSDITMDGAKLFAGKNNCGEKSLYDLGEQNSSYELVKTIASSSLPKANIIKIDTEGSEIYILKELTQEPDIFLIEYHSNTIRQQISQLLSNYILYSCDVRVYGRDTDCRGILKYIHSRFYKN
jgi:FkbM family methyltransferase